MSGKRANPSGKRKPPKGDNFKLIKGVTHSIESRLHEARIFTFSQLAAISPANLAELMGGLKGVCEERIIEQEWISQAQQLAANVDRGRVDELASAENIGNEGFVVDLFLDDEKRVRKTQVLQVKSGEGEEWEGWDEARLINFFLERAQLRLSPKRDEKEVVPTKTAAASQPAGVPADQSRTPYEGISLRGLEMIRANHQTPSKLIKSGEPFNVRLSYGMDDQMKASASFEYTAFISAIKYGENSRQLLRRIQGMINAGDDAITVEVNRPNLRPGLYKIEAALEIGPTFPKPAVRHSVLTQAALQVY